MHVGVKLPSWGPLASFDAIAETAGAAEAAGFASVWVSDHVAVPMAPTGRYPMRADGRPPFDPTTPFLDPLVALAWAGARTSTVQLGTGVLVLPLRHPVVLAKQVGSLDVLSGGRTVLGVGAGWLQGEFEVLGQPFEQRGRRTDDAIDVLRRCWGAQPVVVEGFEHVGPVVVAPPPVQGADLPVLIGGHSPAALGRAARRGDGWYASGLAPDELAPLAADVRARTDAARPGLPMLVGVKPPVVTADAVAALLTAYEAAGADAVVLDLDYATCSLGEAVAELERLALAAGLAETTMAPIRAPRPKVQP